MPSSSLSSSSGSSQSSCSWRFTGAPSIVGPSYKKLLCGEFPSDFARGADKIAHQAWILDFNPEFKHWGYPQAYCSSYCGSLTGSLGWQWGVTYVAGEVIKNITNISSTTTSAHAYSNTNFLLGEARYNLNILCKLLAANSSRGSSCVPCSSLSSSSKSSSLSSSSLSQSKKSSSSSSSSDKKSSSSSSSSDKKPSSSSSSSSSCQGYGGRFVFTQEAKHTSTNYPQAAKLSYYSFDGTTLTHKDTYSTGFGGFYGWNAGSGAVPDRNTIWSDGNLIYVAHGSGTTIHVYTINSQGKLVLLGSGPTGAGSTHTGSAIYGYGNYAYLCNSNLGIQVYWVNANGVPTLRDTDAGGGGVANGVWGDGNKVFVAMGTRLDVFTHDANGTLTYKTGATPPTGGNTAMRFNDVWSDGTYIYTTVHSWPEQYGRSGLYIYTYNSATNTLNLVTSLLWSQAGGLAGNYPTTIHGDGTHIYITDLKNGLLVYNLYNGSTLSGVASNDQGGEYGGVAVDGDYVYAANGNLLAHTLVGSTLTYKAAATVANVELFAAFAINACPTAASAGSSISSSSSSLDSKSSSSSSLSDKKSSSSSSSSDKKLSSSSSSSDKKLSSSSSSSDKKSSSSSSSSSSVSKKSSSSSSSTSPSAIPFTHYNHYDMWKCGTWTSSICRQFYTYVGGTKIKVPNNTDRANLISCKQNVGPSLEYKITRVTENASTSTCALLIKRSSQAATTTMGTRPNYIDCKECLPSPSDEGGAPPSSSSSSSVSLVSRSSSSSVSKASQVSSSFSYINKCYTATSSHLAETVNEPGTGASWTKYWKECRCCPTSSAALDLCPIFHVDADESRGPWTNREPEYNRNLTISQGDSVCYRFAVYDHGCLNLLNKDINSYIKLKFSDESSIETFTTKLIGSNIIELSLTAKQTTCLPVSELVYSCEIRDNTSPIAANNTIEKLLQGYLRVEPEVTRNESFCTVFGFGPPPKASASSSSSSASAKPTCCPEYWLTKVQLGGQYIFTVEVPTEDAVLKDVSYWEIDFTVNDMHGAATHGYNEIELVQNEINPLNVLPGYDMVYPVGGGRYRFISKMDFLAFGVLNSVFSVPIATSQFNKATAKLRFTTNAGCTTEWCNVLMTTQNEVYKDCCPSSSSASGSP